MAKLTGIVCDVDQKMIPTGYPNYAVYRQDADNFFPLDAVGGIKPEKVDICSLVCLRKWTIVYEGELLKVIKAEKEAKAKATS